MSAEQPLHIVELVAENVKRLRAVRIRPDGALVLIGGRNEQGKSSLLDSLEMALGGGSTIPVDPVRHGARKARIVADLGEIVVERTFSPKGTQLVVRGKDGVPVASPQKLLDSLVAKVSFDPLAFTRMKPQEQDKLLKQMLGLNFTELDTARARVYEQRTADNREIKRLEALLESMPELDRDIPEKEVSVSAIVAEIDARNAVTKENDEQREALRRKRVTLEEDRALLGEIDGEIQALEERLAAKRADRTTQVDRIVVAEKALTDLAAVVARLVDPEIAPLKEQIRTAEQTNAKVREERRRGEIEAELQKARASADECTGAIESIDEDKAAQLAAAKFPIAGLGFDDVGPTLNGVPLEQASQAQKIRLSVSIGAALNPRVRVMLVREGAFLDEDSLRLLAELARETGTQCFVERVGTKDPGAVIIEDGEVVERAETAAE